MEGRKLARLIAALVLGILVVAGCKVGQIPEKAKGLPPGVMSGDEVYRVVNQEFRKFTIKMEPNIRFHESGLRFVATGFDQNLQIGLVYSPDLRGYLSEEEIQERADKDLTLEEEPLLKGLEKTNRIFFLVIRGGSEEEIANRAFNFAENLVERGIIKLQVGSALTAPEDEKAGETLEFEKKEGRKVAPGEMQGAEDTPETVLENIEKEKRRNR